MPPALGRVYARTLTPLPATALVTAIVLVLSLGFPVEGLAAATSTITLLIFASVNLALWRLKARVPVVAGAYAVPRWAPLAGCLVSLGFLLVALSGYIVDQG